MDKSRWEYKKFTSTDKALNSENQTLVDEIMKMVK